MNRAILITILFCAFLITGCGTARYMMVDCQHKADIAGRAYWECEKP